uniref:RNA helicase n=1 Tax=Haptolina brevifila TaxID=156173 RepID=A0A7S2BW37_9EUKA|mmetsp:Transcript_17515/g.35342  ORF Transcript_17515/g.35342 Transcript_17515/m.35342 type:complete len:534 (+) Transcript_17515:2-1603(+)
MARVKSPRVISALVALLGAAASLSLPRVLPPCNSIARRTRIPVCLTANTFEALGVRAEIVEALAAAGVREPNVLQQEAIPAVLGRQSLVIGAQTGSGKTFTYLAPVMQSLKLDEDAGTGRARARRPRAIVLLPTRELALQVHDVAKAVSHRLKLRVGVIHGGVPDGPQRRRLEERPLDLLVATPGRLLKLMEAGSLYLGDVRHVVLDEVDTMFEAGFGPELDRVLQITTRDLAADPRPDASGAVQHLAVGATHPESALVLYDKWLRSARRMLVKGSHTVPSTLRQEFLTCNGPTAKVSALRDLLGVADASGKPSIGRSVLFCNSQQSARFVDHTLVEDGYKTANYHGAVPANERASNFKSFLDGEAHVLVTTDLAARGLDNLDVAHVVQFDFAKSAADYVHRCGRTARAGRTGTVTSLVTKADIELVRAIREAQRQGGDLIAAGAEHERRQRTRAATELQVAPRAHSGRPKADAVAAVFPDCRGISSANREPGASAGRGSGERVKGTAPGRQSSRGRGRGSRGGLGRSRTRRS